ncbi:MAG: serine/threonine-protein kinase [Actinomycetes bacterium]
MADLATSRPTVLGGRYRLDELIGRGGMADVYAGVDQVLGRRVAVKLLRAIAPDSDDRARFEAETRTLARLSHPGLVTVLDAGTEGELPYLVMELVPGTNLAACCSGRSLDPDYVAAVGAHLGAALAYVHEQGVVHRDVKPGNVLLRPDGRVLLADFGIAKLVDRSVQLTSAGITIGTAPYLAPEQVGGGEIGPATDVYSFGLVLLEMLTGERAYPGAPVESALARLSAPPNVPQEVPAGWQPLLRTMTATNPGDRPTMAEVRATIETLSGDPDTGLAAARLPLGAAPETEPLAIPDAVDGRAITVAGRRHGAEVLGALRSGWSWLTPRQRLVGVGLLVGAALVLLLLPQLLAAGRGSGTDSELPANVPVALRQDLRSLHQAAAGVPALAEQLSRVDGALVDRDYPAARAALDALIRDTIAARDAGQLSADQADSIMAASAQLIADLPSGVTNPSPTPTPTEPGKKHDNKGRGNGDDNGGGNGRGNGNGD